LDEKGRPPRLHDLRHSFIVNALQRQYELGNDAQSKLPHLANYVGHVEPSSTHYYLQMTPEIREAANHLFHQRFGAKLNHGGSL
jgi:integrase